MFQKIYFKLFLISLVSFASFYESHSLQASSLGLLSRRFFRNPALKQQAVRVFSSSLPQEKFYSSRTQEFSNPKISEDSLQENPFFKEIWFNGLNDKKNDYLNLKEKISKNEIPKRKLEEAKHHLRQLKENLVTLEKNEKYILEGALIFYSFLELNAHFFYSPIGFNFLSRLNPILNEALRFQDPEIRIKILRILKNSTFDLHSAFKKSPSDFDRKLFLMESLCKEVADRRVLKLYPHLAGFLLSYSGLTGLPENFPKIKELHSQKDFICTMTKLLSLVEYKADLYPFRNLFPSSLKKLLEDENKSSKDLLIELKITLCFGVKNTFEQVFSSNHKNLFEFLIDQTVQAFTYLNPTLAQVDLEPEIQSYLLREGNKNPTRILSYLSTLNAKPKQLKLMQDSFIAMIREESRPKLTLDTSEHINNIFSSSPESFEKWQKPYEIVIEELFEKKVAQERYRGYRALISSDRSLFFKCFENFGSCLDSEGIYSKLIGSIMEDPHHRLVLLLKPDGSIFARKFIRLGQRKIRSNYPFNLNVLFLEKTYSKGTACESVEMALNLLAYRFSEEMQFELYTDGMCEKNSKTVVINLGKAAPSAPDRYSDASSQGYLSEVHMNLELQVLKAKPLNPHF